MSEQAKSSVQPDTNTLAETIRPFLTKDPWYRQQGEDALAALVARCEEAEKNERAARQLLGEPTLNAKTLADNMELRARAERAERDIAFLRKFIGTGKSLTEAFAALAASGPDTEMADG